MSTPSCKTSQSRAAFICNIFILLTSITSTLGCFDSIISFGDSKSDTGNLLHLIESGDYPTWPNIDAANLPYGETFFGKPTGRFSDGRLVIDFLAEHFGLPLVPPYFGANGTKMEVFGEGVNFAVAAATAIDYSVLKEKGIINGKTNVSLSTQLGWFKDMLASACPDTSSNCKRFLESSVIILGGIGGNDIHYAFSQGKTKEELQSSFYPLVMNTISLAIKELIGLGARTVIVPGSSPNGCVTSNLAYYNGSNDKDDYDPSTGCIIWLNELSQQYNELLLIELHQIQQLYPHTNIIYADYYNATMQLYTAPEKYGFTDTFSACCGAGGLYNYNSSVGCKVPPSTSCDDPSSYVNWDGSHSTEAAYRATANGLLDSYCIPPINSICSSISMNGQAYS